MQINWPELPKKGPMEEKELLQLCKTVLQELHDRWTNPSWTWCGFTHDPLAVLEEIDLYLKEGGSKKVNFREFI